ncbi:M48 family metallopeptidase [Photobacterium leiognathi]|uniref:M48 family metallopeptidase n=1 Tax=Photobacterium leiognathi TaxID=553611 RepID=UPI00298194B6|nr:M48 family metallopeptidase [Photobacterium leiognathi]
MNVSALRHPKENLYRMLCIIIGGLIWAALLLGTLFSILVFLIPIAFFLWLSSKFFQASIFGNAVHVNNNQYTSLNTMANEIATALNIKNKPEMFIVNAQGLTNALAVKFLARKYTLLFSDLVDLLWEEKKQDQLRFVIAHELAHHAAGHVNFWINLLMKPAMFVPFLGSAYSRACELTCDRIAAEIVNDKQASLNALIALASGSKELLAATNNDSFVQQELSVPAVFGFLQEITSSHPRMTKRVIAINNYQGNTQEPNLIAREA